MKKETQKNDHMEEKHGYTGNRTGNRFTAYLLKFIKGRRSSYLSGKIRTEQNSFLVEEIEEIEARITFEEMRANREREQILMKETGGVFPEWDELSDERIVKLLLMLSDTERELIYLHVFEERSFAEIGQITGMTTQRCKDVYFYGIRKIRKRMGEKQDEI